MNDKLARGEFIKSGIVALLGLLLPKPVVRFVERHLPLVGVFDVRTSREVSADFFKNLPNCPMNFYIVTRDCRELPQPDEDGDLGWY